MGTLKIFSVLQFPFSYKETMNHLGYNIGVTNNWRVQSTNNIEVERQYLTGRKGYSNSLVWACGGGGFSSSNNVASEGLNENSGIWAKTRRNSEGRSCTDIQVKGILVRRNRSQGKKSTGSKSKEFCTTKLLLSPLVHPKFFRYYRSYSSSFIAYTYCLITIIIKFWRTLFLV